jgi:fused signal recognition particle receptor
MAGFFKKLFNRITGRKEGDAPEATQEDVQEQAALPSPAPEPESEPVFEEEAIKPVPVAAPKPAKTVAPAKAAAKKAAAPKRPDSKKPEPKKTAVTKRVEAKKPSTVAPPKKATAKAKPEPVAPAPKPVKQQPPPAPGPVAKPAPVPEPVVVSPSVPEPVVAPPPPPRKQVSIAKPAAAPKSPPPPEPERKGWFSKLTAGLSKSSKSLTGSITAIFTKRKLDAETLQDLEDTLIQADLGLAVSERIIKAVSTGRYDKEIDPEEVKQILAEEVARVLKPVEVPFNFGEEKPFVVLVVGVNGSGKTTTIGKLGAIAAREGFKVKFVACDTFRAAAIEQLTVWGKRIGVDTMSRPQGSDASGLAFDAMKAAGEDGTEIMFIDTAGRLHNKTYLMDELDKVVRVIKKYDANAPHAVLLVLDATTGQNALAQANAFTKVAGVTGLIMTKLDGTARGGILVAIAEAYKLPIHAIGVGESIDDLQPFDADGFAKAIAGLDDT